MDKKKTGNHKLYFLLVLTILFAFFIRIYNLANQPEGLDQGEASFGYNAYSLLKTGRDEYGRFLPPVLESIGDYKLAAFSYWMIPFIYVFGLSEFSVRFSTVIAGIISILLIYSIAFELFHRKKLALLTTFILAISPWHIVMSRIAYEAMLSMMFFLLSIYLFINWYKNNKYFLFILSVLSLSLSTLTYYSAWLVTGFILIIYGSILLKRNLYFVKLISTLIILILPIVSIVGLLNLTKAKRLSQINSINVNAYPLLQEQIREDQHEFPLNLVRFYHNKISFYPISILQNLSKNFSLDYLFLTGDKIDRRFYVPYNGVLYLSLAPFFYLGLLYLWKNYSAKMNLLLLGLLFIVFLGSAFSNFGSETQRTLLGAPICSFIIAYGMISVYEKIKILRFSNLFYIYGVVIIYNIASFNHQYYWHGNMHQPWGRNYGELEMVNTVKSLEQNYKKVIISGDPSMFFYFYNKVDPHIVQAEASSISKEVNFIEYPMRSKIGNYLTMPINCPSSGKLNVLYVCQGSKIPLNSKIFKVISYRDGQPRYIFLEFTSQVMDPKLPLNYEYMENSGIIPPDIDHYW